MGNVAKQTLQMVLSGILERGLVANDPETGVLVLTDKGQEWWKWAQENVPVSKARELQMDVYTCHHPMGMSKDRCLRCVACLNWLRSQAEPFQLELTEQETEGLEALLKEEEER